MTQTLLILAGGTGGHIMPGLAIARAMSARGWHVRWLGSSHGMENRLVPEAGLMLDTIAFSGLRGKGVWHAARGALQLVWGMVRCLGLIRTLKPALVLGMGGYVTVPGGLSAAILGRPLVLINSDARLLLSNKLLQPFARRVLFGLPSAELGRTNKAQWTGCPVRREIAAIPEPEQRYTGRTGPLRILVVGGSLGATILNEVIPRAIALTEAKARPSITHQAGPEHVLALARRYRELGVEAEVLPFIDDMAQRYAWADLVICRAGATTICELAAAGVASLLIPLMVSTTSHQRDNAAYMADSGAAIHVPQASLDPVALSQRLQRLTRSELLELARTARTLGRPDATETVATVIQDVARKDTDHEA